MTKSIVSQSDPWVWKKMGSFYGFTFFSQDWTVIPNSSQQINFVSSENVSLGDISGDSLVLTINI